MSSHDPTTPPTDPTPTHRRVALLGNPNTGKTTLFNRLCGVRHKTSNFPGTTQEARLGTVRPDLLPHPNPNPNSNSNPQADATTLEIIDLPGIYSLELQQAEADVCRGVLEGSLAPAGHPRAAPDALLVLADGTNLSRNLVLVGEALRRRLPTVVAISMADLARARGLHLDASALASDLGCAVVPVCGRTGEGVREAVAHALHASIPNRTPPGTPEGLEAWAEQLAIRAAAFHPQDTKAPAPVGPPRRSLTDRLDHVLTHPLGGPAAFAGIMFALFYAIFSVAQFPMHWIELIFEHLGGLVEGSMPEGILREFLVGGIIGGVGSTVIFLPQICLLFFLISLLEDTGYLARAAFVTDRLLRPFGLPGHAFVPLLSSHACALPGIMAARAVPDRRDRLATILVAPFMSCTARIPVYVLLTGILFKDQPAKQAAAFVGCYALGLLAGLVSALIARRTILRGTSRPMALELPTYKRPGLMSAALTSIDRGWLFLRTAGTTILAICIVLWWLSSYPKVEPPPRVAELRAVATDPATPPDAAQAATTQADALEGTHALASSFAGRIGKAVQPVFAPLGYDWQLSIGVITSFAAREVFVGTMAVIVSGSDDAEDQSVRDAIATAKRSDGITPIFTVATSWSLLIYYVLAMQCLPTLAVTAREAGGTKWALLQLGWMSLLAYGAALLVTQTLHAAGIA